MADDPAKRRMRFIAMADDYIAGTLEGEDLMRAHELVTLLANVGSGSPELRNSGDLGRLRRSAAVLTERQEPLRMAVLEHVEGVLRAYRAATDDAQRQEAARWLRFMLGLRVDERFHELSEEALHVALSSKRAGPVAVAAELSIACNAFGDLAPVRGVRDKYRKAADALR